LSIYNISLISGISYLSRAQEEEALQKLNVLHHYAISASPDTSEQGEDIPLKSTADLLFTERMKIRFSEWRDAIRSSSRVDNNLLGSNKFGTDQFQTVFFKMRPAIMLNGFTSHQIKLIQQVLPGIPLP
jgi:poly(A)-specific ribonuclease